MNCSACRNLLHEHADAPLPAEVAAHVTTCPACHAEHTALRALRTATAQLPRDLTPARDLWPAIASEVERVVPNALDRSRPRFTPLHYKLAACFALLAVAALTWHFTRPAPTAPAWPITTLAGSPRLDARALPATAGLRVGQWLETDATSRAQVAVAAIGEVRLAPNSRVRLIETSPTEHRLELARGQLTALIWAPPRLFFVETPSATAIDLGCAYTLDVDDAGNGTLHVTSGYVALQHGDRESVISAGQMCATRRGAGPGTPFVADAPAALRAALDDFDFKNTAAALPALLAAARPADAVTLWHLLSRVAPPARASVFDALAAHHTPPANVTRAGILAGDAAMRRAWADALNLGQFTAP